MSTIPKGSTDNYSKHVKKIDKKGNLQSHPRLSKKQEKNLTDYMKTIPKEPATRESMPKSKPPTITKTEKYAGAAGKAIGKALASGKEYLGSISFDRDKKKL